VFVLWEQFCYVALSPPFERVTVAYVIVIA
jgi:hypothetical protein